MTVIEAAPACLLCGAPDPAGHVLVVNGYGQRVARVCSSHTLWDVIRHPGLTVTIEVDDS